jgi:hypothetical protein
MKYFKIIINIPMLIFTYIVFTILNLFYPIYKLLLNKYKQYQIKNITDEHKVFIDNCFNDFANKFDIEDIYKDKFIELLHQLSKYEIYYVEQINNNQYCYLDIRYILNIIELAKDSIVESNKVDTNNRKASYYENTKYSSMDNLIQEYLNKLSFQKLVRK